MAVFPVNSVDIRYFTEKLNDFLPERIFDMHTHVYMPKSSAKGYSTLTEGVMDSE